MERALRLVPALQSLEPLRALLVSASRPDENGQWSSSAGYMTLGKRRVEPVELRTRAGEVARRLAAQCEAAITALDLYRRGEEAAATMALVAAGEREEQVGRLAAARAWYLAALGLAEGLADRRPEIATLLALGSVDQRAGSFGNAARRYQRSLALAEAGLDDTDALSAALALGEVALELGNLAGARAWYTRGLRQAESGGHRVMTGRLHRQFAELALREGDVQEALSALSRARACFRPEVDAADLARILRTQGAAHEAVADRAAAADYREALMWALRAAGSPDLEVSIRLCIARLHLRANRLLDAEEEMRRAEERALADGMSPWLVRVYIRMGEARGAAGDEGGFVFFEQAIEICRTLECASLLEAEAYQAYGGFREALGDHETAVACFERTSRILEQLGVTAVPGAFGSDPRALRTGPDGQPRGRRCT